MAEDIESRVQEAPVKLFPEGDCSKYHEKHIAMNFPSREIVAYGNNLGEVLKQANKSGKPFETFFCPDPKVAYIY